MRTSTRLAAKSYVPSVRMRMCVCACCCVCVCVCVCVEGTCGACMRMCVCMRTSKRLAAKSSAPTVRMRMYVCMYTLYGHELSLYIHIHTYINIAEGLINDLVWTPTHMHIHTCISQRASSTTLCGHPLTHTNIHTHTYIYTYRRGPHQRPCMDTLTDGNCIVL